MTVTRSAKIGDNFNNLGKSNKSENKKAYLKGLVVFNSVGKKKGDAKLIKMLLKDNDPSVRESAILAAKLNLEDHQEVLSDIYKSDKSPNVKYLLELYGYHITEDKQPR